jgi:hypothetical protein
VCGGTAGLKDRAHAVLGNGVFSHVVSDVEECRRFKLFSRQLQKRPLTLLEHLADQTAAANHG